MSPEAKAKARAAAKARHKGTTLQPNSDEEELADTGSSAPEPGAAPATPAATDKSKSANELPTGTRTTYDKHGLVRKSLLVRLQQNRRKLHHYDLRAPRHTAATRAARKLRKHSKIHKDKDSAEPRESKASREPAAPLPKPDPTQPAAPTKQPSAPKKDPKAPKPDPTQPSPDK